MDSMTPTETRLSVRLPVKGVHEIMVGYRSNISVWLMKLIVDLRGQCRHDGSQLSTPLEHSVAPLQASAAGGT